MAKLVALDSNALTYLIEAVRDGYLPQADPDAIAPERLAMFRLFCYATCDFWVPPTVRTEYLRISDPAKREPHDRWASYHLEDVEPGAPDSVIDRRASALSCRHADLDDCRIVAECEAASAEVLLTSDGDLVRDLVGETCLTILRPTEFFASLAIVPRTTPQTVPAAGNPLRAESWWRV
jgi:hypothetical protein